VIRPADANETKEAWRVAIEHKTGPTLLALSRQALRDHFASHPAVGYAVALNLATVIGQRLQLFQAMWLREMQRTVELRCA